MLPLTFYIVRAVAVTWPCSSEAKSLIESDPAYKYIFTTTTTIHTLHAWLYRLYGMTVIPDAQ